VGSHVAELLRSEGWPVRALHRTRSEVGHLRQIGCELVEGDLQDDESRIEALLEGCDTLVHTAALVYSKAPWSLVRKVNSEGAARLFRAAVGAGLREGIQVSSVAVYGEAGGSVREDCLPPPDSYPASAHYARSKRQAEDLVREATAEGQRLPLTILRPSVVYGERDRLFTPKVASFLRGPLHPLPGGGNTHMPVVYAGNLAGAVGAVLNAGTGSGVHVYNVAEDHPVTQRQLFGQLADALGYRFRPLRVPVPVVALAARAGDFARVRIPGAQEVSLRRAVRLATRPNPYDSRLIREKLEWRPHIGLEAAVRRTAAWFSARDREEVG